MGKYDDGDFELSPSRGVHCVYALASAPRYGCVHNPLMDARSVYDQLHRMGQSMRR